MYRERKGSNIYKSYKTKKDEGGMEAYVRRPIELYILLYRLFELGYSQGSMSNALTLKTTISAGALQSAVLWYRR